MRPLVICVIQSPLCAYTLTTALAITLTVTGCGGSQTTSPAAQINHAQPAIGAIARMPPREAIKSASLEDADRFCCGADYASELPSQRVTPQGTQLLYSPSWDEGGEPGQGDLAYAMYVFSLDGFDDEPELTMHWGSAPADWGCCFVGLGNQLYERWDWFTDEDISDGLLTLEDLAPYLDGDGGLVMIVLMTGTDSCTLGWLRWGGNVAPVAVLEADPTSGTAPLAVSFSANASYDPDGALTDFEWDFDGNGVFNEIGPEADAHSSPTASYTYNDAVDYTGAVRVTDNDGATDTAIADVNVTPGQSGWVLITVVDYEGSVNPHWPSLAVVDGCPAISYSLSGNVSQPLELWYTRASTASGMNEQDWCEPIGNLAVDASIQELSLAVVDGNPAIACWAGFTESAELRYLRSTTPAGTDTADWSQVVSFTDYPQSPQLAVVAGRPAIAYGHENKLYYLLASTSTGATAGEWAQPLELCEGS